ncbi:hypothetical protein ACWEGX_28860 [Streptomyces chartreusis]
MVAIRPCGTDRVGPLALRDSPETRPESLTAADYAGWETSLDEDAIGARTTSGPVRSGRRGGR